MAALYRQLSYSSLHVLQKEELPLICWGTTSGYHDCCDNSLTPLIFIYACLVAHTHTELKNRSCMSRRQRMWGWQPAAAQHSASPCHQQSGSLAKVGESLASAHSPSCSCISRQHSLLCRFTVQTLSCSFRSKLKAWVTQTRYGELWMTCPHPSPSQVYFNQCLDKVRHGAWALLGNSGGVSLRYAGSDTQCRGAGLHQSPGAHRCAPSSPHVQFVS